MSKFARTINAFSSVLDKSLRRAQCAAKPLRIHFEINDICNLRCRMCARMSDRFPRDTGEMDIEVVRRVAPWFKYATYVGLAGNGEPFLHSRIMDVLRLIVKGGSTPSVVTNMTLLDQQRVDELVTIGPLLLLASIDGATKETYEYIREGADFEKVVENLTSLNDLKKRLNTPHPALNFVVCLMKKNVNELADTVRLAHSVGATLVVAQNILPYNEWAEENMVKDENLIRENVNKAQQAAQECGIGFQYIPMGKRFEERPENKGYDPKKGYFCEFIWQQLHVEVDGHVRYCCFWTEGDTGHLLQDSPENLWNSQGFQELRKTFKKGGIPQDCETCHMRVRHDRSSIVSTALKDIKTVWK